MKQVKVFTFCRQGKYQAVIGGNITRQFKTEKDLLQDMKRQGIHLRASKPQEKPHRRDRMTSFTVWVDVDKEEA